MRRKVRTIWVEFVGGPHDGESLPLKVGEEGPAPEYRFMKREHNAVVWREFDQNMPNTAPRISIQRYTLAADGIHYNYVGEGNA